MLSHQPELRDRPWQTWHVKDGNKGPMVWEVKHVWFYPRGVDGLPQEGSHLIVARNVLEPEKLKFFVAHAPRETSLGVLLKVAFSPWRVERCFEDEKTELGFDHFEGRSYIGLMRHQIITALTHLFVARMQQAWRGGNPELTVRQIRSAAAALVQSWWLKGNSLLQRTATTIINAQRRNAASRKSHRKRTIRRSHQANITLRSLPQCLWDDGY